MRMPILCIIALMQTSAYAIEKMECLGTEPFWGASINDRQLVLDFAGDKKTYPIPTFKAAAGTGPDYVTSIQARNRTSSVVAFVVNENLMIVADKNGKAPPENVEYQAYCSDGMSDRAFPYSIFLMVDGKPFVGCCSTGSNPFKEPH
jgi:uncharacterized membrane protein